MRLGDTDLAAAARRTRAAVEARGDGRDPVCLGGAADVGGLRGSFTAPRRFLIVEDKVHSSERGDQIRRYVEKAQSRYEESEIVPIYLKTGNESPSRDISIRWGPLLPG